MDPSYQQYVNFLKNQSSLSGENSSNPQNPIHPPQPTQFSQYSNPQNPMPPPQPTQFSQYPYSMYPPPQQYPNQFMYQTLPNWNMSQTGSWNARVPETQLEPNLSTQLSLEDIALEEGGGEEEEEEEQQQEEETHSKAKRTAWTDAENMLLVQSWLNVSKDSILGNDQKGPSFWEKITINYNKFREPSFPMRESRKAKAHYQKLSKCVQFFVGCYNSVTIPPKNGHSEADNVDEARSLYLSIYKKQFKFVNLWRVLKEEPKWRGAAMATSTRQKNTFDGAYTSSSNPSTPIDVSDYEAQPQAVRPPGQKAAKRKSRTCPISCMHAS